MQHALTHSVHLTVGGYSLTRFGCGDLSGIMPIAAWSFPTATRPLARRFQHPARTRTAAADDASQLQPASTRQVVAGAQVHLQRPSRSRSRAGQSLSSYDYAETSPRRLSSMSVDVAHQCILACAARAVCCVRSRSHKHTASRSTSRVRGGRSHRSHGVSSVRLAWRAGAEEECECCQGSLPGSHLSCPSPCPYDHREASLRVHVPASHALWVDIGYRIEAEHVSCGL